ncbi:MAG: type VI secretion system protein TssA [Bryobacterales bacterium]|nr:type VI secretion system protein TssA [Bryobacterales bacterium]
MPLRDDLLNPLGEGNPCGVPLRFDPVYDKIKEARRQDDNLAQGIWSREVKRADYATVIRLAGDAIATRGKDLQLTAWLVEALVFKEGVAGLRQGLAFTRELLERYWDSLYPELEDGDPFMRAGILEWIGSHLGDALRSAPLTRGGLNWYQYKESRAVGSEESCGGDTEKLQARSAAIEEGKIPAEQFDEDFQRTPKAFYTDLKQELDASAEELRQLEAFTDRKFTEEPPSFSGLRAALEELQQTAHVLLAAKRGQEPDEVPAEAEVEPAEIPSDIPEEEPGPAEPAARRAPARVTAGEPACRDDAVDLVIRAAAFLRREEPYSPVPYLMLRALRWGELRAGGDQVNPALLETPPTEIRQRLKRAASEGLWEEVLEVAETAMGMPCGRGWLDLQRYAVRACSELGSWYDPVAQAIRSELRVLLADYPGLPDQTLTDDTPAANRETQEWLAGLITPAAAPAEALLSLAPIDAGEEQEAGELAPPDASELAEAALRAGRHDEAIAILSREIASAGSGRERFQRRLQLARVCLASGKELIAFPILQDLAAEIENRRLEEWETPEATAQPLVLLHRCMTVLRRPDEERQLIYGRICRLDPVQAMSCG